MSYLSGKQAFLQMLTQEGVSVMFGNPGTTELGEHIEKVAEVGPALGRGLANDGPYLIDVRIDSTFK